MVHEPFLTTDDVIRYLQVNLRTVYRLLKAGRIPAVRVGRQWRFRKADLDAWLEREGPSSPRATAGRGHRVLVCEPDAEARESLAHALHLAGYEVDGAPDASSALERLRANRYDLLVTEARVPGASDLDLARRARQAHPDLPILVATAYSSESLAIDAIALRVSAYFTKPIVTAAIVNAAAKAKRS